MHLPEPRYPQIHVAPKSRNPLVWVSEVRHALRRSGVGRDEIERFSDSAFASGRYDDMRRVCSAWADLDLSGAV